MLQLTTETIARAAQRTREHHPRVSRLTDCEIAVTCGNADHPRGHVTRFERRADRALWGECFLRATGEACPAALGKRICYHLSAGAALFLALEEMRRCAGAAEDRDGLTEIAVMLDAPLPRPAAEKAIASPRVTVREFQTPGGTKRELRYNGVAI